MKAIFVTFDQAHKDAVITILEKAGCRGFTSFADVQGRGSKTGDPHYGSHAWPSITGAVISVVEDDKVDPVLKRLKDLDNSKPMLGLRAFVWNIEKSV